MLKEHFHTDRRDGRNSKLFHDKIRKAKTSRTYPQFGVKTISITEERRLNGGLVP